MIWTFVSGFVCAGSGAVPSETLFSLFGKTRIRVVGNVRVGHN